MTDKERDEKIAGTVSRLTSRVISLKIENMTLDATRVRAIEFYDKQAKDLHKQCQVYQQALDRSGDKRAKSLIGLIEWMKKEHRSEISDLKTRLDIGAALLEEGLKYACALVTAQDKIKKLEAEIESLQPQHHYMTKMGAELQEEVTRLHSENKILREHEANRRKDCQRI